MTLKAAFAIVFIAVLAVAGTSTGVFAGGDTSNQCVSPCTEFTDPVTGAKVCNCPNQDAFRSRCTRPPCVLYTDPVTGQLICACP
jgi:hypothetical protein